MKFEGDEDIICNWYTRIDPWETGEGTGRFRNKSTSRDDQENINKNGQNTKKSPGDLRRLAVTQT